jgi:hypothetical protein
VDSLKVLNHKGVNYYPINAQTFVEIDKDIPCFLKIKDHVFTSDAFKLELPQLIEKHQLETVYIQENDLSIYTQALLKNQKINQQHQSDLSFLSQKTQLALWSLKKQGLNHQNFALVDDIAKSIVNLGLNQKITDIFKQIPASDSQKYLIRTFLTKLLCIRLKFTSESTLYKITVASLLCDIGLYVNPENKFHGQASIDGLTNLKISSDIEQIILHHHENNDGTGPLKMTRHKIHPLAKVLRVCDEFCELLFVKKQDKTYILAELYVQCPKKFETNLVQELDSCFKK